MIRHLSAESFAAFGTILPEKERNRMQANHHSLALQETAVSTYRTVAPTWLSPESGDALLSVSADNESYTDFYLDQPVRLERALWFRLTSVRGNASAQMAGWSLPLLVQTRAGDKDFALTPRLKTERIYAALCREKEQGFLLPGQAHPMAELVYVDQGSIHSVAEGQELLLQQGDLVLYAPEQWHMQYADVGVAPRLVSITFEVSGCPMENLTNRCFRSCQKAITLLQQILREQERGEPWNADVILSLMNLLLITLQRESEAPNHRLQAPGSLNNENEIVAKAQRYIGDHVADKLSVPVVAAGIRVSPSYLTALFQKHLQISPGEYIRRIKLQESKRLIREGEGNMSQIAERLHYSTIHHFSRQFKEKFGITPSEYAKSVR